MGAGGHHGAETTLAILSEKGTWSTIKVEFINFCYTYIYCMATEGGYRTPRPRGEELQARNLNEFIQFDFLYIGKADTGDQYIIIIKDEL